MVGGAIGAISMGRSGGSSIELLHTGTWRQIPLVQSHGHVQAAPAGVATRARSITISRVTTARPSLR
jgi:hypothetical protein